MRREPSGGCLSGAESSRADVAPPSEPAEVVSARAEVAELVAHWRGREVLLLRTLVLLGSPLELLHRQRVETVRGAEDRRGPRVETPPTSALERAASSALGTWREIEVAAGLEVIGAPGSVHASIGALDGERGR